MYALDQDGFDDWERGYFEVSSCIEDWILHEGLCLPGIPKTNGSQFIFYTDANHCGTISNLPANNGTNQSCYYTPQGSFGIPEGIAITPDKETTAGMLIWFFWFFLLIGLIVLTEVTKLPILAFLSGLYGAFLGLFVAWQFSLLLGVIITIICLIYTFSRTVYFLEKQ